MVALKDLAENGWIATLAYFFAFMPWGIIYAFDFIGDRWKSIRDTRKAGVLHIILTLLPLSYVLFYASLQFVAKDYKEMAAALVASVLSILHVLRTIWGLIQLTLFEDWTFRVLKCMSNMGYTINMHDGIVDEDGLIDRQEFYYTSAQVELRARDRRGSIVRGQRLEESQRLDRSRAAIDLDDMHYVISDSIRSDESRETGEEIQTNWLRTRGHMIWYRFTAWIIRTLQLVRRSRETRGAVQPAAWTWRKFCSEKEYRETVKARMIVNSSLIDNVFYGSKLPVRVRKDRWHDMRCTKPEECLIRWSVAFLSQFGAPWLQECSVQDVKIQPPRTESESDEEAFNESKSCIRCYRNIAVFAFLHVTHQFENQDRSLIDPGFRPRPWSKRNSTLVGGEIKDSCFPYKCGPDGGDEFALKRFKHTITDARNSWDTSALNALNDREHAAVDGISAPQIASFLYIFDKNPITSREFMESLSSCKPSGQAGKSLLRQLALTHDVTFSELMNAVPIPNAFFYVPLWSHSPRHVNRLILQASVHVDNWLSLDTGDYIREETENEVLRRMESAEDDYVFEAQKCFELVRLQSVSREPSLVDLRLPIADENFIATPRFLGCILETVRSEIAEWIFSNGECDDWELLLTQNVQFSISPQLEYILQAETSSNLDRSILMRLLWEAQSGMQKTLDWNSTPPHATHAAAFLCILGFPSITLEEVFMDEEPAVWESSVGYESSVPHTIIPMTASDYTASRSSIGGTGNDSGGRRMKMRTICPMAAPQDIRLLLRFAAESSDDRGRTMIMCAANAEGETGPVLFKWKRWRDAFLGRLYAHSKWRNYKGLESIDAGLARASEVSLREGRRRATEVSSETEDNSRIAVWHGWRPHNPAIARFEVGKALIPFGAYPDPFCAETDLRKAIDSVKAALSGEDQAPQPDHIWIEDCRSIVEMHNTAMKELDENNPWKALKGLSFCVQEFAHKASLDQMFKTVLRNDTFEDAELDIMVASMSRGAMLLGNQTDVDISTPYKRFSITYLGNIFAEIYSKTGRIRALEYSMIGERVGNPEVEALHLSVSENRAHLFLAIHYQGKYLRTKEEAANERAIIHLSEWGKSLELSHACLSVGFLLEKGSFPGREAHKLHPLLSLFQRDPLVKATILERFLSKKSLSRDDEGLIRDDESMSHDYESMQCWLHRTKNGLEPDLNSASEVYTHAYKIAGADPVAKNSVKSIALNRQGLIKVRANSRSERKGADRCQALVLFQHAVSWAQAVNERVNKFVAVNNVGAVFYMQSHTDRACREFEKVMHGSRDLEGEDSWETRAGRSTDIPRKLSSKPLYPATTAANNLAVAKERRPAETDEVVKLYEEAVECGHPAAMYNYAVYLVTGPKKNGRKAEQLLEQVLLMEDQLIPMYKLISMVTFLRQYRLSEDQTWFIRPEYEEIDGCLAIVKRVHPSRNNSCRPPGFERTW